MNEANLFPEKEIIDMKFIELVKFGDAEIKNKADVDKALAELSFLRKKTFEIDELYLRHTENLREKFAVIYGPVEEASTRIKENVKKYYEDNFGDLPFQSHSPNKSVATISFDHGEITIVNTTKTEFKIKALKGGYIPDRPKA